MGALPTHRGIMTQIQPIPTTYRGVRFRSRLEARWAVFYDALGLEWHYEHEGYQLPSGWYLPDFWLPSLGVWIEIKPTDPGHGAELQLCEELAAGTHKSVLLFFGEVNPPNDEPYSSAYWIGGPDCTDMDYHWCVCLRCGKLGVQYQGRGNRICREKCHAKYDDKGYSAHHPRILAAYEAARVARFWDPTPQPKRPRR